jgi:AcrR family transcriptional regulator
MCTVPVNTSSGFSKMTDKQAERRAQIEAAAFVVLEKSGYKKASMLQIAKQAKASNETLYAWYGNKQALFSSLIASNAQRVEGALRAVMSDESAADDPLVRLGRQLLEFTTTANAIIINRAAVADVQDTGLLAEAIETHARQAILQAIETLMAKLADSGVYRFEEGAHAAAEVFVSLLLGDLQMQQALGSIEPLTETAITNRAQRVQRLFDKLFRVGTLHGADDFPRPNC